MEEHSKPARFAFVTRGTFSHINTHLRAQLSDKFTELAVDPVDIWPDLVRTHPLSKWVALAQALVFHPRHLLARPSAYQMIALRTSSLFRRIQQGMRSRLAAHVGEYSFTFQTQSIFDASVPGVPHYVFTDHTHLANLQYPTFRRRDLFSEHWLKLEREIYANARHLFVMSEHVKRSACADYGVPESRVSVVGGGSDIGATAGALQNADYSNQTVVFVGIDWERKGGPHLVAAMRLLRERLPQARLIVVGCAPGIREDWCEEVGRIPQDEVARHLVRASVFSLPSQIEPYGMALIEAQSCGLPVVVSSVGELGRQVTESSSGLVVPPGDPRQLADALCELLRDPARCRAMGEAGKKAARERAWPAVGEKIAAVIRSQVAG